MAAKKREYLTTPIGTLKYPHLQTPHAFQATDAKAYYSTSLILRGQAAAELRNICDTAIEAVEKEEGKKVKDLPYVEEEDGSLTFKFKCNPTWKDGKSRKPSLFDKDGAAIVGETFSIGGGTKGRVRFSVYPWKFGAKVGIRLEPWAVQIVDLVEYTGAGDFGFDAVEAGASDDF